jgi:hypothetical protein
MSEMSFVYWEVIDITSCWERWIRLEPLRLYQVLVARVIQVKRGFLPVQLSCYKTAERGCITNTREKRKLSRSFRAQAKRVRNNATIANASFLTEDW